MKKQVYKITKTDWFTTCKVGSGVTCHYDMTLKEAKEWSKGREGIVQFFKMSYEFKDVKDQRKKGE